MNGYGIVHVRQDVEEALAPHGKEDANVRVAQWGDRLFHLCYDFRLVSGRVVIFRDGSRGYGLKQSDSEVGLSEG